MSYKHLFFDLDHTLWDFEKNSNETLTELFYALGVNEHTSGKSEDFIISYQNTNRRLWYLYEQGQLEKSELRIKRFEDTLRQFGIRNAELTEEYSKRYLEICPKKTHLFPHALEILEWLQSNYEMNIITNGFEEVQHIKLEHSGLACYFKEVITSEKAGAKKPHRAIFDHALERTGGEVRYSIMIGDNYNSDIEGARRAGWDQIFFNPHGHAVKGECTHEIASLKQLEEIF